MYCLYLIVRGIFKARYLRILYTNPNDSLILYELQTPPGHSQKICMVLTHVRFLFISNLSPLYLMDMLHWIAEHRKVCGSGVYPSSLALQLALGKLSVQLCESAAGGEHMGGLRQKVVCEGVFAGSQPCIL